MRLKSALAAFAVAASLAGPALAGLVSGGWLAPGALVVVEEAEKAEVPAPEGLERVDDRVYSGARLSFFLNGSPDST